MGAVSKKLIIGGGIVVALVILLIATGSFKFSATPSQTSKSSDSIMDDSMMKESMMSDAKSYENATHGFSLMYPGNWSLRENPSPEFVASFSSPAESSSDAYREFLGVKIVDVSSQPNATLAELADLWEEQTVAESADDNFQIVGRDTSTVAGYEARDIVFTATIDGIDAKGLVRIVLYNNKAYIYQYFAEADQYDKYLPQVEENPLLSLLLT